jgi:hypothetical protein
LLITNANVADASRCPFHEDLRVHLGALNAL